MLGPVDLIEDPLKSQSNSQHQPDLTTDPTAFSSPFRLTLLIQKTEVDTKALMLGCRKITFRMVWLEVLVGLGWVFFPQTTKKEHFKHCIS